MSIATLNGVLGQTGLTARDRAAIDDIPVLNEWISNEGDDYAEGEPLLKADSRRLPGGAYARFRGNGTRLNPVRAPKLSVTVLDDWELIGNAAPTVYPGPAKAGDPPVFLIKGFEYHIRGLL